MAKGKLWLVSVILGLLPSLLAGKSVNPERKFASISVDEIEKFKKQPCVVLHAWAAWCMPCVKELPSLLETFSTWSRVTTVIVDMDTPAVQEKFSKPWLNNLNSKLTTFLKKPGQETKYRAALDKSWTGALPFTVLYAKGQKVESWTGVTPLQDLQRKIQEKCS